MSLSFVFFNSFLFFCDIIVKSCELRAVYHAHPFNFILKNLELSEIFITFFLVAYAMSTAKQHHLVLADNTRLLAARQPHLAAQHDIEQMLFEKERALVASRSDTLVDDAAAIEYQRRGGIIARHHRRGKFDNPVHPRTIYNLVCKITENLADQRMIYLEIVFEFWL